MAFVVSKYFVSWGFQDYTGYPAERGYEVVGNTLVAARANATSLRALEIALTDASLVSETFSTKSIENDPTEPTEPTEAKIDALISATLQDPSKHGNIRIPIPLASVFVENAGTGANVVDVAAPDVLALLAAFQTTGGIAYISDGEFVSDTIPNFQGVRRVGGKRMA